MCATKRSARYAASSAPHATAAGTGGLRLLPTRPTCGTQHPARCVAAVGLLAGRACAGSRGATRCAPRQPESCAGGPARRAAREAWPRPLRPP
eukprot:1455825-Prymnesium_polylepis.1